MATIIAAAGGGNWTTGATWAGGVAPTAADDAVLDATSGNVTITSGAVCRSLDCTGYTGTLTHTAAVALTIGDGTAGAGGIALKLAPGMTYTLGSTTTSTLVFVSTAGSVQTIDTGGKTTAAVTVNGPGASYQLASGLTTGTGAANLVTLTAGTLDTNGQTCSWGGFASSNSNVRTLTLGASSITVGVGGWTCATATNMTLNAGTSVLTFNGGSGSQINLGTNLTYNTIAMVGSGVHTVTASGGVGTGSIVNFTRTGTAVKTDELQINAPFTVTGTLTLAGNSTTNRLLVGSNVIGNARAVTVGGSVVASNVDIGDVVAGGAASWDLSGVTGGSGDTGGNTGITFTASAAQTWQGDTGGNWSDAAKWTTRVPLPQDDVTMGVAFAASQTVTMDMPRLGRSISWAGMSGAPAWAVGAAASAVFGDLTLAAGMSITGTGVTPVLRGRGSRTLTSNGVGWPAGLVVNSGTGTYTLADALTVTGTLAVGSSPHRGNLVTAGHAVTCAALTLGNAAGACTLTLGSSTVTLTGASGTVLAATVLAGTVLTAGTSTIVISGASASDRTIAAHGFTLNAVSYTVAGSSGRLTFGTTGSTGTVTVGTLTVSDASGARGLRVWAGTTLAVNTFAVAGGSGRLITVDSSTPGTRATLSKASGVVAADYLSVKDTAAGGGAAWYAGANSTDAGNNTGWIFADAPAYAGSGAFLQFVG